MAEEEQINEPQIEAAASPSSTTMQATKKSGVGELFGRMKLPLILVSAWAAFSILMGVINLILPVSGWMEGVITPGGLVFSALGFYTTLCMILALWIGWVTIKEYGETLKQAFFAGALFGLIVGVITKILSIIFVFINAINTFFQYSGFSIEKLGRAIGKAFEAIVASFGLNNGIIGFLGWLVGIVVGIVIISVIEGGLLSTLAGIVAMGKPKK